MKNTIKIFILVSSFSVSFFSCNKKNATTEVASEDISNVASENHSGGTASPFEPAVTGYENLVAKAKEYEENGRYVYAAGYYFDAMEAAASEEDKNSATENLERIAQTAKNNGESRSFEFCQYFTEFSPFSFSFSKIRQDTDNFACDFSSEYSQKFFKLKEIASYYSSEMEEQWNMTMGEAIIQNNYFLSNIAFLNVPSVDDPAGKIIPSFEAYFYSGDKTLSTYFCDSSLPGFIDISCPYILDISFCGSDGTVLKSINDFVTFSKGVNQSFDLSNDTRKFEFSSENSGNVEFTSVPEDIIQKIKNNEVSVKIDKIYAPYGNLITGYEQNLSLYKITNLPKLSVKE